MPRQSAFKDQYPFDLNNWVVTIFNAGEASSGHAALLVEGEDDHGQLLIYRCEIFARSFKEYLRMFLDQNLSLGAPSRFEPLYRAFENTIKPVETQDICYVSKKQYQIYPTISRGTFSNCTSYSWKVTAANANRMLDGIDAEKTEIDISTRMIIQGIRRNEIPDISVFTLFRIYGHDSTLETPSGQSVNGINCVNWCEKHLPNAGITPTSNISDSFAAKPEWHAAQLSSGPFC